MLHKQLLCSLLLEVSKVNMTIPSKGHPSDTVLCIWLSTVDLHNAIDPARLFIMPVILTTPSVTSQHSGIL